MAFFNHQFLLPGQITEKLGIPVVAVFNDADYEYAFDMTEVRKKDIKNQIVHYLWY